MVERVLVDQTTMESFVVAMGNVVNPTHAQYGMQQAGTATANTTALQTAANDAAQAGVALYIPAGRYKFTSISQAQGLSIIGESPDLRIQERFGGSQFNLTDVTQGTWLISTATSGNALSFQTTPTRKVSLTNIGVMGPGTGTSVGIRVDNSQRFRVQDVLVANFATGWSLSNMYFGTARDLQAWGCLTGVYCNNVNNFDLYNTNLQFNSTNALRLESCSTNGFFGGCTEVNNGTPILIDLASSVNVFYEWYFEDIQSDWPQPITYAFEVRAGCDFNGFHSCHWPSSGGAQIGMIRGNHTQVLWPQGPIALDLGSSGSGTYIGSFSVTPTYTANTASNFIMDFGTTPKHTVPSDLFFALGKRVYFGPGTNYGNWIGRNTSTADTEINSATSIIKGNQNFQSPALIASGLTGSSSGRYVGSTTAGPPTSGTYLAGDFVNSQDGNFYTCTVGGTPGTWVTVGTPAAITAIAADAVAVGQVVPDRDFTSNSIGTVSGVVYLTYFTADKTEAINTLTTWTGTTAAAASPTLCKMGAYSVATNGDLTLVASTANDTSLFAATSSSYSKALLTTWNKVVGQRYATAVLIVSAGAMPTFQGKQFTATGAVNSLVRVAPATIGRLLSQTDLPNSVTAGSLVGYQAKIAMQLS